MNAHELIGLIAAKIIKQASPLRDADDTTVARFLLDRLTREQVAEICRQILYDVVLQGNVEIKLPQKQYAQENLPESLLTDERTTYWRNASCDKPILILANNEDDQRQSLRELTSLGSKELKGQISLWIEVASSHLPLTDDAKKQWAKALQGLQQADDFTLEKFADYVVSIRNCIERDQFPIVDALGFALPALDIPRDTCYFQSLPEKSRTTTSKWQKMYQDAITKRACLLRKHLPNQQRIDDSDLRTQFDNVRDQINQDAHECIEDFIKAPDDWTPESAQLAQFEWDTDGISGLFTGLRTRKVDLATETIEFFENEDPSELTQDDQHYLENLSKRRKGEAGDEDTDFYDCHHLTLSKNRSLKAKWDRFVYGKPIECTDFIVGLLSCIERLVAQAGNAQKKVSFLVKTQYDKGRSKWLNALNNDVGLYFCTRYQGIDVLTDPWIEWDTSWLFRYDELLDSQLERTKEKGDKYTKYTSLSREATQLKFTVSLDYEMTGRKEKVVAQLIWKYTPTAIGMELHEDLRRLSGKPFLLTSVNREPVSKKGHLQEVALDDISTFEAAFRQDRGSLVSTSAKADDAAKIFNAKLQEAVKDGRVAQVGLLKIREAWNKFAEAYRRAIENFAGNEGIASESLLQQADEYNTLLTTLRKYAPGDQNRVDLWHPILGIGIVRVLGGRSTAIIAPWHPLRLFSLAVKARQFAHFARYIIKNPDVDFGDDRLFFFHLRNDMEHPYYPEVAIGFQGAQPKLLSLSDTVNDYSLMEIPLRDTLEQTTNENPHEASEKVREVVRRYLDLQPHKKSSMSIALFNCDSKGLPIAVVEKLASLYETKAANEICCQIILRHQNTQKLSDLYEKMIESVEADPDAFITSESENDFMSRLRIGIMATDTENTNNSQEKKTDIVFLQDVISRQAQIVWIPTTHEYQAPSPLHHFPARWSRRHPTAHGDLRSIVYLVCPSQPTVGMTYLDTLHDVIGEQTVPDKHFLPARQVSFQDEATQRIFQEVHQLGEWVVNYDDLLERRLLRHQNVTVIKYQQNRSQDRNLIISSTSSFQLLQVLVKQRLEKLNLPGDLVIDQVAQKFIEEAKSISGDIVLRAARRGANASELIGLVLSQYLLYSEIQEDDLVGWFFLDDYANWLGQDEQQIADIMALVLEQHDDAQVLKIIISEAKYIEGNVADARKTSQKQLKETVKRMQDALFKQPSRLDRDIWLARLSDLLIDGVVINPRQMLDLRLWGEMLRKGEILIEVRGYSHVFAPFADSSSMNEDTQIKISGIQACFQEIFDRKHVQNLVQNFARNKSALPVRERLGDHRPWQDQQWQFPTRDTFWIVEDSSASQQGLSATSEIEKTSVLSSVPQEAFFNEAMHPGGGVSLHQNHSAFSWTQVGNSASEKSTPVGILEEVDQWSKDTISTLQRALMSYNMQAKTLGSRLTPNALLIRLKGSDRLSVEDIEKKKSVLLTTHGLKIFNISAQPGEIVISIARDQRETVSLLDVWKRRELFSAPGEMNVCYVLGIKEMDGEILYLNLGKQLEGIASHAPHTLIAGSTGSGKSVLMQNLLLDICQTNSSQLAHIYLIDPKKGVDYQQLTDLPHLREGIITEQERAQEVLTSLVLQMDQRYDLLAKARVNNLADYNKKVASQDRLPMLWLVHDEFADWMLVSEYKEAVSTSVQRLGTKARAAGIHLIFAAQRPEASVLPPQLRDNLGNRLILRVESQGTSEIALGEKGAEKLLGRGHLAAKLSGEVIFAQVPFLSLEEQAQVVEEIRRHDYRD